jgi:DNA-binding transcriptional regulator YbjK
MTKAEATLKKSEQTRTRILEAALALLPRHGLAALRVRQVAAKAGVNLGMFHYHSVSLHPFPRPQSTEIAIDISQAK